MEPYDEAIARVMAARGGPAVDDEPTDVLFEEPFAWKYFDQNSDQVLQPVEIASMHEALKADSSALTELEWKLGVEDGTQPWVRDRIMGLVEAFPDAFAEPA